MNFADQQSAVAVKKDGVHQNHKRSASDVEMGNSVIKRSRMCDKNIRVEPPISEYHLVIKSEPLERFSQNNGEETMTRGRATFNGTDTIVSMGNSVLDLSTSRICDKNIKVEPPISEYHPVIKSEPLERFSQNDGEETMTRNRASFIESESSESESDSEISDIPKSTRMPIGIQKCWDFLERFIEFIGKEENYEMDNRESLREFSRLEELRNQKKKKKETMARGGETFKETGTISSSHQAIKKEPGETQNDEPDVVELWCNF